MNESIDLSDNIFEEILDGTCDDNSTIIFNPNNVVIMAPGKNKRPISVIFDEVFPEYILDKNDFIQRRKHQVHIRS